MNTLTFSHEPPPGRCMAAEQLHQTPGASGARYYATVVVAVCVLTWSLGSTHGAKGPDLADTRPAPSPRPPTTEEILELIDVDPYHVPPLPLMTNQNYARSSEDVEPFGAVKPFKEHFLIQMEYTGPGRALPEPEHVANVKIGFLGPIMPTVSVATGGQSHEEVLGIAMLRGCRLAVEQANERGGYLARRIPFELVVRNDNGLWGASGNEIITMAYKDQVWAILGTVDGARVLNQMRARGMRQPFLACDRCVSDDFVRMAGPNAEGVLCTYPWDPTRQDPKLEAFRKAFRERWGAEPDTYAAHAYDGINMFVWAIQRAGLNRAKIRDVLAHRPEPFPGVTGDIPLSAALDDAGEVFLARYENGHWRYYWRAELDIPRGKIIETPRAERTQASVR